MHVPERIAKFYAEILKSERSALSPPAAVGDDTEHGKMDIYLDTKEERATD